MNALARYNYPQNPNLQNGSQGQHGLDPASLSNQAQGFGHGQQYNQNHSQNQTNHSQTQNAGPLSPRSTAAAASAYNLDPSILQTTIGSLLQSPAAAQMFLNSLNNSVQGQTLTTPLGQSMLNGQSSYPFPSPHQQQPQSQSQLPPFSTNSQNDHQDPTLALFSPLPNQEALMQHTDNLQRSYQGAADMSGDVDKLQESIDSLVRSMGLEPNPSTSNPALGTGVGSVGGNAGMGDGASGETLMDDANGFNLGGMGGGDEGFDTNFDVDQFLTELARSERQIQDQSQMQGQGQGQGQVQEDRKPQV
jgi:heat shock transcription factor